MYPVLLKDTIFVRSDLSGMKQIGLDQHEEAH